MAQIAILKDRATIVIPRFLALYQISNEMEIWTNTTYSTSNA